MLYARYGEFCALAKRNQVIFFYVGYFSQSIVSAMADAVKTRIEQAGAASTTRRKLFSSFIEMAQNITHYSAVALTPPDQVENELRQGSVCLGMEDSKYYLLCANPVDSLAVDTLRGKLDSLKGMSIDEIKDAYKQFLRSDTPEGSKGAGLGFLTMARDATEPLQYEFVATENPAVTMFYLKATV